MYIQRHLQWQPPIAAECLTDARDSRRPSLGHPRIAGFALVALVVVSACGTKAGQTGNDLQIHDGIIIVEVNAYRDTVMQSTSRVLMQERIDLRRYEPESGIAESGFIDLAKYPAFFDSKIWDNTERLVKLRFLAARGDSITVLQCEPLYNPYEVITDELDNARLRRVPLGHPGFDIAAALTRRIAAHAEGRAVASP